MKFRRLLRELGKWGAPVAAVGVAAAWWWSGTTWVTYVGPGEWRVSAVAGLVGVAYEPGLIAETERLTGVPVPRGLRTLSVPRAMAWGFRATWEPGRKSVAAPLWVPAAIAAGVGAAAWRAELAARRRGLVGRCPKCRYDRAGLPAGAPCPECGAVAEKAQG